MKVYFQTSNLQTCESSSSMDIIFGRNEKNENMYAFDFTSNSKLYNCKYLGLLYNPQIELKKNSEQNKPKLPNVST